MDAFRVSSPGPVFSVTLIYRCSYIDAWHIRFISPAYDTSVYIAYPIRDVGLSLSPSTFGVLEACWRGAR